MTSVEVPLDGFLCAPCCGWAGEEEALGVVQRHEDNGGTPGQSIFRD